MNDSCRNPNLFLPNLPGVIGDATGGVLSTCQGDIDMFEMARDDFLSMITEDSLPVGQWIAIVLAIPTEWLHQSTMTQEPKDAVISGGEKILRAIDDGAFARIGWTKFFKKKDLLVD